MTHLLTLFSLTLGCRGLSINEVTTGETPEYPEVKAQRFVEPPGAVMRRAKAVADEMPGWQNCSVPEPMHYQCEAVTPTLGFVDDVQIWVEPLGPTVTVLKVRSASRVGKGDLGANAKRILAFQAAVEESLVRGE